MLYILLVVLAIASKCWGTSHIALFSDTNCQASERGLEGPNGYPNGTCTDIRRSGPYGSFQVVGLDPGCTVTIYMEDKNTTICGGYQEEIRIGSCHNGTFVYYSIDFCDLPGTKPSTLPSPEKSSETPIGAIVGGVVGGLAGLGIILGLAFFMWRKKRQQTRWGAAQELGTDRAEPKHEMGPGYGEKREYRATELSSSLEVYKHMPVEVEQPPVELAGHDVQRPKN